MNVGTKSLLFGCHQVLIHPVLVYTAWVKLYHKLPNPKETVCIVIHDWGYWGKPNMDGEEGEWHPKPAALFAAKHFDTGKDDGAFRKHGDLGTHHSKYFSLCMFHSRFMARKYGVQPSKLCLPDKYGVALMPAWMWVGLGTLSGEIHEYMKETKYEINSGPAGANYQSPFAFFRAYKEICAKWVKTGDLTIRAGNTVSMREKENK